jgi:hypothetical protein
LALIAVQNLYVPDCVLTLSPFPKFGSRSLHAATICGSICGKTVACRFGVPSMIGRMQSDMIPSGNKTRPCACLRDPRAQVECAQIERLASAKE